MDKDKEYRELVETVKKKYSQDILGGYYGAKKTDPFYLKWCDECDEINLWTYWQGRKSINADIILVGQDWASAWEDGKLLSYIADVLSTEDGCSERYIKAVDNMSSPTDDMLRDLLKSLGEEYDPFIEDNSKLFFTNLCLGYRDHGVTGGLYKKCLEDDVQFLERLIAIVEPKLVIFLGKDTFDVFAKKTKITVVGKDKNFYNRLASGTNYAMYEGIPVFGQAHTGSYGVKNRIKYNPEEIEYTKENGKKLMIKDWSYMAKYLHD